MGWKADGGKTGSAPRYVNNLNNTDVHKGATILHGSGENLPTQRKAALPHGAKVAPNPNSDSLATLSAHVTLKAALNNFLQPFPGLRQRSEPACHRSQSSHAPWHLGALPANPPGLQRGCEPTSPLGSEFLTGNCLWTP